MYWQDWSEELRAALGLRGSPVALAYSSAPIANATVDRKIWACRAFQAARDGEVVNLTAETSGCPGGTTYMGLGAMPVEHTETIADFLVNGEKLMASRAVFFRARAHSIPPPDMGKVVVISALEKAELEPHLVMFLCNPLQASRLTTLANFETGEPMDVRVSGSTCQTAVAIPLFTGKLNISLVDTTSRHMQKYDPGELIVSIPMHLMHAVMRSIDRCSAGRATIEWPEEMKKLMQGD